MSVKYICRGCGGRIGQIDSDVSEMQLGFHFLTPEERQHMISYEEDGGVCVRILCDYCNDAVRRNPELSLLSTPLQ